MGHERTWKILCVIHKKLSNPWFWRPRFRFAEFVEWRKESLAKGESIWLESGWRNFRFSGEAKSKILGHFENRFSGCCQKFVRRKSEKSWTAGKRRRRKQSRCPWKEKIPHEVGVKICCSFESLSAEWRAINVKKASARFLKKQQI